MTNLEKQILYYQQKYYDGEPEIEDKEFDLLWDTLAIQEPNSPLLKSIGSDTSTFPKANHIMMLGSQAKAKNEEEFYKWFNKQNEKSFIVQYKLDGASIELQYENGKYIRAVTRGDGKIGDDITANVAKMHGVPKTLSEPFTGAVRGEILLFGKNWQKYFPEMANQRNAAVGISKQKTGQGCEHLNIISYDVFGKNFSTETEKVEWLATQKFEPVFWTKMDRPENIIKYRNDINSLRPTLEYGIDGLVVKCNKVDEEDLKRDRPDHQIAFKFDLDIAVSILREVTFEQKGKRFTPVAIVDPVSLCGTTVKRASLHNMDILNTFVSQGLSINGSVAIKKAGEIIPQIEAVMSEGDRKVDIPTHCPTCNAPLIKNGPFLECSNKQCPEIQIHRIHKWINVMNIMHLSGKTVEKLMDAGLVRNIADLYKLNLSDVQHLDGFGMGFQRIIDEINRSRNPSLDLFLAGFDIDGIGRRIWKPIVEELNLKSITDVFSLRPEILMAIPGIGETRAITILENIIELSEELLKTEKIVGISAPQKVKPTSNSLNSLSFCFTGALNTMKRSEAEALVISKGGTISSVKKGLSMLVTNDTSSGSSKNEKASQLNIPIINEEQFLELLK
jgi:DNA ligase (NAD+)